LIRSWEGVVTDLRFSRSVATALKGARTVLFLAPQRRLRKGWLKRVAPEPWIRLLARAANEAKAGPTGKLVAAENPDAGPDRVLLGVLPNKVSRHNCPARSVAIAGMVKGAGLDEGRAAVVLCLEEREHALAAGCAVGRMLPLYRRTSGKKRKLVVQIAAADADGVRVGFSTFDRQVIERARWAAMLADTPTADMHTTDFVRATRRAARDIPHLKVSVVSGADVLARGMGGLHAVGRTATRPPKLLLLRYNPPGSKRRAALIGKGIVYDTGGLSLKTGGHMAGMKHDMGGAAGVVGATLALAKSKYKGEVIGAAALAENAIGPDAYRPDDILKMHSGKTVEINNTDAEGRLAVSDAASYVARRYKPDWIADAATLTGGQIIGTGQLHAAIVSNRAGLEQKTVDAGLRSGDLTFPVPFAPEIFQAEFQSKVADMKNSMNNRMNAQASCGGQFIFSHLEDLDLPWLHVDMAGPSVQDERGTGYGVALLAVLVRSITQTALKG
jgi:probable aminopeptidase NPEPL1